ncbi:MAG: Fe-S cluster assembly protein SufB [Candidatus Saccharibacteria bacterium]|nr:Fe-S cluster assembly protein SufB [Candidatus Saccharibacteria bacterium]
MASQRVTHAGASPFCSGFLAQNGESVWQDPLAIATEISQKKHEPKWMLEHRLACAELLKTIPQPAWGPDLSGLNLDKIQYYVDPKTVRKATWQELPEDVAKIYDNLGIPEAEQSSLAGVGAQFDSEVVYHNLRETVRKKGVIYEDFDVAARGEIPELSEVENAKIANMVREHYMQLVKPDEHFYAALHGTVHSGGSFVYVPKGVEVEIPLQAYFRFNAPSAGQFEHTLIIVDEGAKLHFIEGCSAPKYNEANLHAGCVEIYVGKKALVRYSTVENWSKNMYNLNTKRAKVEAGGRLEWVSGSFGSHVTMLYPCSVLAGKGATSSYLGISLASEEQDLDTGAKMIHLAPHTSSTIESKSIVKPGGKTTFRSLVKICAEDCKSSSNCDSLLVENTVENSQNVAKSHKTTPENVVKNTTLENPVSDTIPSVELCGATADVGHEARVGRISEEQLLYLQSRGLSESAARNLIVSGFAESVAKELPLEYAVEMNRLVNLEMEGGL